MSIDVRKRPVAGQMPATADAEDEILYSYDRNVATLTINRPHRRNALSPSARARLTDGLLQAGQDKRVAVIVITGAGDKAFCSGGDLASERGIVAEREAADIHAFMDALRRSPVPVIAAVKGFAVGSGNWLAYLCDLTIAADNAIFAQAGARMGSTAAGFYVTHLSRVVGEKRARQIWLMCERISAYEALEWGLVNYVFPLVDFEAEVRRICDELVRRSPTSVRLIRASFELGMDHIRPLKDEYLLSLIAPDYRERGETEEGIAAFREKREPDYSKWRSADNRIST